MSRTFYLRHGNEVSGPVTTRQLREMAANGTLRKSDHVRPGNQDKWYVAGVVKGLFADTAQSSEPKRAQTPTPRSRSARPLASPTEGMIDIGGFERDRKRRVAAHRRRTVLLAIAGGFIVIIVVVAVLSGRGLSDDLAGKEGASSASPRTAENVERAGAADTRRFKRPEDSGSPLAEVDFTFTQWQDVLSTCHPDPDYILTDDDVYRAMGIYEFGKQAPTFAANRQRMFNIVAGCYYWNRDKPLKEWKYMLIQKWDPYWDESPHCEIAEDSRKRETERRAKNAKYVRKSTKTPPYIGAFTRQEVWDICKDSTAQIDIEFEITVAVRYRKDLRGSLRSSAEVKDMMCELVCDFVPGNPDRCCECESAIVDFVFHQQGWE